MALAHQLLGDEALVEHFRSLRKKGIYVILDNGVMETGESLPMETLIALAMTGCCDEVVLPDVWQHGYETVQAVDRALSQLHDEEGEAGIRIPVKWQGVVQGSSLKEAILSYLYMLRHPRVDVIGIPKVMELNYGRASFTNLCFGVATCHKPIHLLGLWVCPSELAAYRFMPEIRSCDSNYPAAAALCATRLKRHSQNEKPAIRPQDFEHTSFAAFQAFEDLYIANLATVEYFARGGVDDAK